MIMVTRETVDAALDGDRLLTKVGGEWFLCRRVSRTIVTGDVWQIPAVAKTKARRLIDSRFMEDFGRLYTIMPEGN